MYTIGEFSKINKVTTKTLRHYDEIGLLKPSQIDKFTGYRYYTGNQIMRMSKILFLKQMGFSLTEIIALLDSHCSVETIKHLLQLKKQEVMDTINENRQKLILIESFLHDEKGDFMNNYTVTTKTLPEVIIASYRKVLDSYSELMYLVPNTVHAELERVKVKCTTPAYCFNIYHDGEYRETKIDTEICQAVTELKEDSDIIKFKKLPPVKQALCVLHKGSYSQLGAAYSFSIKWIQDNGYKIIDHPRESFIDGIWNCEKEEDWLTELQFPIEKAE